MSYTSHVLVYLFSNLQWVPQPVRFCASLKPPHADKRAACLCQSVSYSKKHFWKFLRTLVFKTRAQRWILKTRQTYSCSVGIYLFNFMSKRLVFNISKQYCFCLYLSVFTVHLYACKRWNGSNKSLLHIRSLQYAILEFSIFCTYHIIYFFTEEISLLLR